MMAALTTRPFTDEDRKALVDAAKEMVGDREIESLTRYRNNALSEIVKAKKAAESFKG
jgi:ribosome recycling factor